MLLHRWRKFQPGGGCTTGKSCAATQDGHHLVCGRGSPWIGLLRGSWLKPFPVNREPDGAGAAIQQ